MCEIAFENWQTDQVICPHCGYEYSDSWDIEDGVYNCPECEQEFQVSRDISITYSTWKTK
jgi:DNA-directed RNA polymerase subunit RPC12/RpoP